MDWQKVISSLRASAAERLAFSKRARSLPMAASASTECGILMALAEALEAGVKP